MMYPAPQGGTRINFRKVIPSAWQAGNDSFKRSSRLYEEKRCVSPV